MSIELSTTSPTEWEWSGPDGTLTVIDLGVMAQPGREGAGLDGGPMETGNPRRLHRATTMVLVAAGAAALVGGMAPRVSGPVITGEIAPAPMVYDGAENEALAGHDVPALSADILTSPMDVIQRDFTRVATNVAARVLDGYETARSNGPKALEPYDLTVLHSKTGSVKGYSLREQINGKLRAEVIFGADARGYLQRNRLQEVTVWDASGGIMSLQLIVNEPGVQQEPIWRIVADPAQDDTWPMAYMGANGTSITPTSVIVQDLELFQKIYP